MIKSLRQSSALSFFQSSMNSEKEDKNSQPHPSERTQKKRYSFPSFFTNFRRTPKIPSSPTCPSLHLNCDKNHKAHTLPTNHNANTSGKESFDVCDQKMEVNSKTLDNNESIYRSKCSEKRKEGKNSSETSDCEEEILVKKNSCSKAVNIPMPSPPPIRISTPGDNPLTENPFSAISSLANGSLSPGYDSYSKRSFLLQLPTEYDNNSHDDLSADEAYEIPTISKVSLCFV